MTKTMLINPPQRYFKKSAGFSVYFPLGLLNIASMIKDISEVRIFDCLIEDFEVQEDEDSIIYGTSPENIKKAINGFDPDVVGISIPFSAQLENAVSVARICRDANPDIKIIFGGPHASVRYELLIKDHSCDFCVAGEGESTFREFIEKLNSGHSLDDIDGLVSKKGKKIHYTPRKFIRDLDELPLPAYDMINMDAYLKNPNLYLNRSIIPKRSISVITSRGCPYNCVFCSIRLHMGQGFRYHSPDYVIRHLKLLIDKYGIRNFHFEDDNISFNRKRFEEILDRIIEEKLDIKWDTPNGIRADTLDFGLLKKVKKSGCMELTVAIESGNDRVLNEVIKKKTSLDYMIKIVKHCKKLGIRTGAFYVIGFPGETLKEMKETIDLALELFRKYDVKPNLFVATPLYGTELYSICVNMGIIDEKISDKEFSTATQNIGNPLIFTKDFSKEDVTNMLHYYRQNYRKELMRHYAKHPLNAIRLVKDKPFLIKRFLIP